MIRDIRNFKQHFDKEGFFRTGDVGYYDSQGVIYFVEKIENMIHFWMYEVAPNILEARLLGSINIIDAAVVGIPHKENGEVSRFNPKDLVLQFANLVGRKIET